MPLHLVTQEGQPYGSVRRCCEACGKGCGPYWHANTRGHSWTDDRVEWDGDPLNCLKVQDTAPSLLTRNSYPTDAQKAIFHQNNVGHDRYHKDDDDEAEEDKVRY